MAHSMRSVAGVSSPVSQFSIASLLSRRGSLRPISSLISGLLHHPTDRDQAISRDFQKNFADGVAFAGRRSKKPISAISAAVFPRASVEPETLPGCPPGARNDYLDG